MSLILIGSRDSPLEVSAQEPKERIKLKIDCDQSSPLTIVDNLALVEGPLDIYCWYEGSQCLPKEGATFMKESIFEPLYKRKQDAKLYLYSLKAWNFMNNIDSMPSLTSLGEAINRINKAAIECIYSSSFFQYCTTVKEGSGLFEFVNDELRKKEWLIKLSDNRRKKEVTVDEFFNHRSSVFNCIKDLDVSNAYSCMQYVEGYYLIQESVRKGLLKGQKKVQIAFVLPNDEGKYYLDYPKDIEKMLRADFGKELSDIEINIYFHFFRYGNSIDSRPYIDKHRKAIKVKPNEIDAYFHYFTKEIRF